MNAASTLENNVTSLFNTTQKSPPRPYIREASKEDLDWDPELVEQFSVVNGERIRSGESYAIVRPGMERWPLGFVRGDSNQGPLYKLTKHYSLLQSIIATFTGFVSHTGSLLEGIGRHVAHQFEITHQNHEKTATGKSTLVAGLTVSSKLVITNGHTGTDSVRACMVVYLGKFAVGTIFRAEAEHIGNQQVAWHGEVEGMIEKSLFIQDAVIELLRAAHKVALNDDVRATLKKKGMNVRDKNASTLLHAVISWHMGGATKRTAGKLTWGIWERRLADTAIRVLVDYLGRETHGKALDDAFGYTRPFYGPPIVAAVR